MGTPEIKMCEAENYPQELPEIVQNMVQPKMYDARWFLEKFSKIPEKLFGRKSFRQIRDDGEFTFCALGFCGATLDSLRSGFVGNQEAFSLMVLVNQYDMNLCIQEINDGAIDREYTVGRLKPKNRELMKKIFELPGIKQRLVAFFEALVRIEEKEIAKEKLVEA